MSSVIYKDNGNDRDLSTGRILNMFQRKLIQADINDLLKDIAAASGKDILLPEEIK